MEKGVLLLAYAAFVLVGASTIGIGIYYAAQVPDYSNSVAIVVASTGAGMLFVGGLGVFAIYKELWPLLTLVWVFDLALFLALIISCIMGLILGMDVRDPTRTAVDRAFAHPNFLRSQWDAAYCQEHGSFAGSEMCSLDEDGGFGMLAIQARDAAVSTWDATKYGPRDIFANCSVALTGCLVSENSTACVAEIDPDETLYNTCLECKHACREGVIGKVNAALQPAAIVLFVTFVLVVIGISVDRWVAATKPGGDGIGLMVGYAVNGLIALVGLVMSIVVAIGYHTIQQGCPESAECVNAAVYIVVFLGMFMLMLGLLGMVMTKLEIAPCLKCLSIVHCIIALGLLVSAIFVSIVAGQMDTVNAQSEKHFKLLLKTYEQPTMGGENFCRQAKLDENDEPIPAKDLPAGGVYVMDPCYPEDAGMLGTLNATCTGESSEVLSCTGTATPLVYRSATRPGVFEQPDCDTDPSTDAWEEGPYGGPGPGGHCPLGCDKETKICDFDANTDGSAECPAGCEDLPSRQVVCPEMMSLSEDYNCPLVAEAGTGSACLWDPRRYAEDEVRCADAADKRCPVYAPLPEEECRLKIKLAIEDQLTTVGIIAGILATGLFVVMYFTWETSVDMRGTAGDKNAWDGDE